jgi:hypothetical protein
MHPAKPNSCVATARVASLTTSTDVLRGLVSAAPIRRRSAKAPYGVAEPRPSRPEPRAPSAAAGAAVVLGYGEDDGGEHGGRRPGIGVLATGGLVDSAGVHKRNRVDTHVT